MIKDNLQLILNEIKSGNNLGESVTLVGATKFVPVENINIAIDNGLNDIGENKAQEFRDKFDLVHKVNYHFFGRLQSNKIKYLIGKVYLIHSVDSLKLLEEINRQSENVNTVTNVLLELNLGEEQKGGFNFNEVDDALKFASDLKAVKVLGFMAMLPDSQDEVLLENKAKLVRKIYDNYKDIYNFKYLSMGMSNDYKLAIKNGSNMIRVGSKIFGKRQ
ncbi:MAG: YggS family pyridoxal phosphate-dependent enzyme [Clostridia bacterium]|nr:YggS family pyridoxal phosphate-dependent enzyme [Clostridia bacterium]